MGAETLAWARESKATFPPAWAQRGLEARDAAPRTPRVRTFPLTPALIARKSTSPAEAETRGWNVTN